MRLKIQGPAGPSVLNIAGSDATVGDLLRLISEKTSLELYDIRHGYPPTPLLLQSENPSKLLADLPVKLDGEQLIVSATEGAGSRDDAAPVPPQGSAPAPSSLSASSSKASRDPSASSRQPPPLSLARAPNAALETDPPELPVPSLGGTLVLRIMPDDNSCLFRAFGTAFMRSLDSMTELRALIAQEIQAQPDVYSAVVLDQAPDDYCRWIQTESSWGGFIELNILSNAFDIEIAVVDVQSSRVDRFNEGQATRCILVYSGIHYDTIALSPSEPPHTHAHASPEFDTTVFAADDGLVLDTAVRLARILHDKHYYTDTAAFRVRCNVCGGQFVGEQGATQHAKDTGHYDFGEAATR